MGASSASADPLPSDDSTDDLRGSTERNGSPVWERIRGRVEQRLAIVEMQAHRLLDRPLTDEEITEASASAGALARGLGALRQDGLAQLARHLARTLSEGPLDATTGVHLAGTVEDLRTMLASAVAQLESASAGAGSVLAIAPPSVALDAHLWVLAGRGHRIIHESAGLPEQTVEPAVVLFTVGDRLDGRTRTLLKAAGETYHAPLVVLHDGADLDVQRALAQHASTLLAITESTDAISEEIMRHRAAQHAMLKALICGAEGAVPVLTAHGFDVTVVERPDDLLGVVANDGTAVVFGSDVPSRLVLDLTRLVRATPSARRAPIVWEGDHGPVTSLRAERLGVMVGRSVDERIAVRIAAQMRDAAADLDPGHGETGAVLSWPAAQVMIDRALIAAQRTSVTTSIATIDLDPSVGADELAYVSELLTREFRRGDVVGRRDRRRYVIALQGAARRIAVDRMTALAPRLTPDTERLRIGVAEFPGDGRSAEELVEAADGAAARAAEGNGPQVAPTTWRPVGERAVDVLIVDPDPVLGEMVAALLTDRGHRCDTLTDGRDALERLTQSASDVLPRVLVLEVDLGGVDGLTLLRSLRPSGVLAHMEVLVVSSRGAEADIRLALELGAADIIRKPFSITLLLHRVGRLLQR